MSFLNPAILFGLMAAAIPLLIHFLNRSKFKTIRFSTLDFLKELQYDQIRKVKLKQALLLLLRTLIIIFLVLTFARPVLRGPLGAASNAVSSVVIILDNSFSMDRADKGISLFKIAKDRAKELIDAMSAGDQLYLMTATDTTTADLQWYHDFTALNNTIENTGLSYNMTQLDKVLEQAHSQLDKSNNINKEIYIFSDLQKSAFTVDSLTGNNPARSHALAINKENVNNLAVESVSIKTTIIESGKVLEINAVIHNTGTESSGNRSAQLYINDVKVAQNAVDLGPGDASGETFRFILNATGFVTGYVELEKDDILQDNKRYFTFFAPEKIRTALVHNGSVDAELMRLAIAPAGVEQSRFDITNLTLEQLRYADMSAFDVIAVVNVPSVNQESASALADYVENGGGLLLVLSDNTDINLYNKAFTVMQLPPVIGTLGNISDNSGQFSWGNVDLAHPLFNGMFEQGKESLSKPQIRFAVKIAGGQDTETIMSYSDGSPYLLETRKNNGVILTVTSGFSPRLSDIARKTIFAPLVTRLSSYAGSRRQSAANDLTTGSEVKYKLPADVLNTRLEIKRPDDDYDRVDPVLLPGGAWINYSDTHIPGFYTLVADNKAFITWAVNPIAQESVLDPMDKDILSESFGIKTHNADVDIKKLVRENRFGVELWRYFAFLTALLLIVEMLLFRTKRNETIS